MFGDSDLDDAMANFNATYEEDATVSSSSQESSGTTFDQEANLKTSVSPYTHSGELSTVGVDDVTSIIQNLLSDPKSKEMIDLGLKAGSIAVKTFGWGKIIAGLGTVGVIAGLTLNSTSDKKNQPNSKITHH